MLKSLSAALLAVSLLAAPAFAGSTYVKTDATVATPASAKPATQASAKSATQVKLTPRVANAMARHGGRHHARHFQMRRHHHMHRHHMHRHHYVRHHRR